MTTSYTGGTTVSSGTLQIGTTTAADKINASSAVSIQSGGTLSLVNVSGNTFANDVSNGVGDLNVQHPVSTNAAVSGALTDEADGQLTVAAQAKPHHDPDQRVEHLQWCDHTVSRGVLKIGTTSAAGSVSDQQ